MKVIRSVVATGIVNETIMTKGIKAFVVLGAVAVMMLLVGVEAKAQCACGSHHGIEAGYTIEPQKKRIHTEFGLGIGAVYTGISSISSSNVHVKPRFGFQGHLDITVCFGKNFALETKVIYEGGAIDVIRESLERRVKTRGVDIPVMASLRLLNNRIRISTGPLIAVMSNAEYTHDGEVYYLGAVTPTWNWAAAIGVRLGKHWMIDARYVHALQNTTNQFGGTKATETEPAKAGEDFEMRSYKISAGVTLFF